MSFHLSTQCILGGCAQTLRRVKDESVISSTVFQWIPQTNITKILAIQLICHGSTLVMITDFKSRVWSVEE